MKNEEENKDKQAQVKHKEVKKLTPEDLKKVSGGSADTRDCKTPNDPTCLAYIVVGP